ncbi:MAG: hypothetical protein F6K36_30995, partial [Symploca sp. SIO3C6]|nr:hypothetical protein [Symploca sp. SIO3C6]
MLLEHLFYILDPMTNDDDGELLATLQGLCQDPGIRFAHVLEELPWGLVWTQRSPQEQLEDQHHRLSSWQAVLKKQLETLQRAGDRLRNDPRYGLWQQRQQGSDHWQ